jgi:hypothetical protein
MQNQLRRNVFLAPVLLFTTLVYPVMADHGGTSQPSQTRLRTNLTGAAIQGRTPEGHAEFRSENSRIRLDVEVENVNLPAGTVLTVTIQHGATSSSVGTITLSANGESELELESDHGAVLPAIMQGDIVSVSAAGTTIMAGVF